MKLVLALAAVVALGGKGLAAQPMNYEARRTAALARLRATC